MSTEPEQFDQLPEAIVERLRARDTRVSMLTPAADRAIREAARARFAPRRPATAPRRRWLYPAAAAAAVALVALMLSRPFEETQTVAPALADDVDGSGRVDILDAFALARARAADPGAVSQGRIDALTDRIVSLGPTGVVL